MKRQDIVLIVVFVSALAGAPGRNHEAFACGCGGHGHGSSASAGQSVPLPMMVLPMPIYEKWKIMDVVHAFTEQGLVFRANEEKPLTGHTISFDLSLGEGFHGRIETFREEAELKEKQALYLRLNTSGELHTWSFVRDNVLLILPGVIPEVTARNYERALYSLSK